MAIPTNLFTTAFRERRLEVLFAVLAAALVYLATLATAAQGALATLSDHWSLSVQEHLTIELPAMPNENGAATYGRALELAKTLGTLPDVREVHPVPNDETARLLKPWIEDETVLNALPLPALIDVDLRHTSEAALESLRQHIATLSPQARLASRAEGLERLIRLVGTLRALAGFMIGLTLLTLAIAIGLICRAAMAIQNDTLELLHFMGATDRDIANRFARYAFRLSLPASMAGYMLAVATFSLLVYLACGVWNQPMVPQTLWLWTGGLMTMVPLAAVLVAVITARLAVLAFLRKML